MLNRKAVLDKLAERRGFDPLITHHWYSITRNDVRQENVSHIIIFVTKTNRILGRFIHAGLLQWITW